MSKTRRIATWGQVGLQIVALFAVIAGSALYILVYLLVVARVKFFFYRLGFRLVLLTKRIPGELRRELVEIYDKELKEYLVSIKLRNLAKTLKIPTGRLIGSRTYRRGR